MINVDKNVIEKSCVTMRKPTFPINKFGAEIGYYYQLTLWLKEVGFCFNNELSVN